MRELFEKWQKILVFTAGPAAYVLLFICNIRILFCRNRLKWFPLLCNDDHLFALELIF